MNWQQLTDMAQLDGLIENSFQQSLFIFKHSTRCSISATVLRRFEQSWTEEATATGYFLDLLAHRPISNAIAERLNVDHESPQVLLLQDGRCVWHASHYEISGNELRQQIKERQLA
jgi:bacillithiol system protein YtxJ